MKERLGTDNKVITNRNTDIKFDPAPKNAENGDYAHCMRREIAEEPDVLARILHIYAKDGTPEFVASGLSDDLFRSVTHIHIVACGSSMNAGLVGKDAIESLARVSVTVDDASEFRYQNPVLGRNDIVMVISQSGETADTLAALRLAKARDVFTLAVVNTAGSSIAREADRVLFTHAGTETALTSTKTYIAELCVLYLFAMRMAYARGLLDGRTMRALAHELQEDVPGVLRQTLSLGHFYSVVAEYAKNYNTIYFVGRGADYAVAAEAAQKMREILQIRSEAFAAGTMKYGAFTQIGEDTLVFTLNNYARMHETMYGNILEIATRGSKLVYLCRLGMPVDYSVFSDVLSVPAVSDLFVPIVAANVLQLLVYYTALGRGSDTDDPDGLEKVSAED